MASSPLFTPIAIMGASSQLAKDLIVQWVGQGRHGLLLYSRDPSATLQWTLSAGVAQGCSCHPYELYGELPHHAVLNFVGAGDPQKVMQMGTTILDVTQDFDQRVLVELLKNPGRRYIFLSSGSVYGDVFAVPNDVRRTESPRADRIGPSDHYALAKLQAEQRHRALGGLAIMDVRVFSYFSQTQDVNARFFMTDVVRAIRDGAVFRTSPDPLVRDYLHPEDFAQLMDCLLSMPECNGAVDAYSKAPVDKRLLLQTLRTHCGLRCEWVPSQVVSVQIARFAKTYYHPWSRQAADFGYEPTYSSLDTVLTQAQGMLGHFGAK